MTDAAADALAKQRRTLKFVLGLPGPVLRLMAGGKPVTGMGRTLDPAFQLVAKNAAGAPKMSTLTPDQARAGMRLGVATLTAEPEPGVAWEALTVPTVDGGVPARAYRPARPDGGAPLMVWLHQGGGVIGDLETSHAFCTQLAATTGGPVLSIDYRLAPEHAFPAGYEDALAAYRWGRDNADRFGAPKGRAALGGDSMGGYFTAAICAELKRESEAQPVLQLMVYPAVDAKSGTASMTELADAYPLSTDTMDWFLAHYSPGADPDHPRISPLRIADLSGLAPAIVIVAGFDPLTDQGEAYAKRLEAAGVPTVFKRYDALPHAFLSFGLVKSAHRAAQEIAGMVRDGLRAARP